MTRFVIRRLVLSSVALALLWTANPGAQALRTVTTGTQGQTVTARTICGQTVPTPRASPPSTSGPVVYLIAPCFPRQGGRSRLPPETYLRDIRLKPSQPSRELWTPYDAAAEQAVLDDFQRLWKNNALTDLSIEIRDFRFSNGVIGKLVTYNITERN